MRVALISFAHVHAESYLQQLCRRDDVDLIACEPDGSDRGRDLADREGVPFVRGLADVEEWSPDAVVIASDNAAHRPLAEWAAARGYDILCEKPLATKVSDGRAIVDACEAVGVKLMVAYPMRFSPAFDTLRAMVQRGDLGEVLAVYGANNGKSPVGAAAWFADPLRAGGGSIMDHTVHIADLLDVLFDGAPAAEVYADANSILFGDLPVESAGLVSVKYADGRIATIECGWTHPDASPTWGGLEITVVGGSGIVELDAFPALAVGYVDRFQVALAGGPDLDALMIDEFVMAINEDRAPQPDGRAGLRSLAIVEAAYASLRSHAPAAVDPDLLTPRP